MSNLKLDVAPLNLNGDNYMSWTNDVKTHLRCKGLENILTNNVPDATKEKEVDEKKLSMNKAKALKCMRQHLDEGLKLEYMNVDDPKILWDNLKKRFGYQKQVLLPALVDEWNKLRFQDFKSVSEYNSAMFRIVAQLEFCGKIITEGEKLEKTYATFHTSMRGYTEYSELIVALLLAEKNNDLLIKNHQPRPTGVMTIPEANATTTNQGRGGHGWFRGRGRGRGRGHFRGRGRGRGRGYGNYFWPPKNEMINKNQQDKGKYVQEGSSNKNENSCFRCGKKGHWAKACRTPGHICKMYKASLKNKEKEVNFHEHEPEDNSTYLEAADFTEGANMDMDME